MSASCLMVGAVMIALAPSGQFSLEWTHSVEKEGWREHWQVTDHGTLRLVGAAVKGSGAGMEPGPGGHFENGWWVWKADGPEVPELELAASGATVSGWTLCAKDCQTLGVTPEAPIRIAPCPTSGN
ncbi:DUF1850 domain-containing protein [Thioclava sp. L04-15]|uniref:DUF1850 domain-containing protein n=1 Tax=Thioclava sp. L04-15 TaxID=1915318 RepID=UPI001FEF1FC0|nr:MULTISPECIES: DUF1850 domain-containing protein [unclassified Thioclava]